jgi:segregation and condensation protein B
MRQMDLSMGIAIASAKELIESKRPGTDKESRMTTQAKLQLEDVEEESSSVAMTATQLKPILEALIYVADEPIAEATLVTLLGREHQQGIREGLHLLQEHYQSAECGLEIKEVAGGYKMATKAEHHDWVRNM